MPLHNRFGIWYYKAFEARKNIFFALDSESIFTNGPLGKLFLGDQRTFGKSLENVRPVDWVFEDWIFNDTEIVPDIEFHIIKNTYTRRKYYKWVPRNYSVFCNMHELFFREIEIKICENDQL